MTTALDARLGPKVLAIVARLGTNAVFRNVLTSSYAPGTLVVTKTTADVTRKVSPPMQRRMLDPQATTGRDQTMIVVAGSGLTFTPTVAQVVTVCGQTYSIETVEAIRSGDDVAAWMLGLKG